MIFRNYGLRATSAVARVRVLRMPALGLLFLDVVGKVAQSLGIDVSDGMICARACRYTDSPALRCCSVCLLYLSSLFAIAAADAPSMCT